MVPAMRSPATTPRMYLDTPKYVLRPRNTDLAYVWSLVGMSAHADIDVVLRFEAWQVFLSNFQWACSVVTRLLGKRMLWPPAYRFRRCLHPSRDCDAIYTHGPFPKGANKPVLWFYGVVDPEMRLAAGQNGAEIEAEYRQLSPYFDACSAVLCPTRAFRDRHRKRLPKLADRFVYAPFFMDNMQPIEDAEIVAKHVDDEVIRVLFVGREYKRKGLDILADALARLPEAHRQRVVLDVVSVPDARAVLANCRVDVRFHAEMPRSGVMDLMRRAHVFVMPSRFETYGLVYLEAMASGCAVVGAAWESQRELFSEGAGIAVGSDSQAVSDALARALPREARLGHAFSAARKVRAEFTPERVAERHRDILAAVLGRSREAA
jgi:glycosyltransferase involved in cell wall biosynthesis